MQVMIVKAGQATAVQLPCDQPDLSVRQLASCVQDTMDIPVHKQKLIVKGKVMGMDQLLAEFGVRSGSKIMLLECGPASQVRPA